LEAVREALAGISCYDRTNYESLWTGINTSVLDTWGSTVPVQILLITDGSGGFGPGSLKETIKTARQFEFPAKMNVLSLGMFLNPCFRC
jgi:hypothetical protein